MNLELKVPTSPRLRGRSPLSLYFHETLTRTGLQLAVEFVDFADDAFFE